jgi:hypothetical protein
VTTDKKPSFDQGAQQGLSHLFRKGPMPASILIFGPIGICQIKLVGNQNDRGAGLRTASTSLAPRSRCITIEVLHVGFYRTDPFAFTG